MKKIFYTASLAFLIPTAFAGPFKLSRTGIPAALPTEIKTQINTMFDEAEASVNTNLPNTDASSYLKGMSNASVMTTKGLGVDYASNIDLFIVGGGFGAGVDAGSSSLTDILSGKVDSNKFKGVGVQTSIMAGLQLGVFQIPVFWEYFDLNRMNVYLNYMSLDLPKFSTGFSGDIKTFGFHLQYKAIKPIQYFGNILAWGGLDITTGLESSNTTLKYQRTDKVQQTQVVAIPGLGNNTLTTNITATSQVGALVSTTSIPFEISTSVRFLYLFSLFGGFAFDINSGTAKALVNLDSNVDVDDSRGLLTNNPITSVGSLDLGQTGNPTDSSARYFMGLQLNLSILKMYVQLNQALSHDAVGIGAGLRIAW